MKDCGWRVCKTHLDQELTDVMCDRVTGTCITLMKVKTIYRTVMRSPKRPGSEQSWWR